MKPELVRKHIWIREDQQQALRLIKTKFGEDEAVHIRCALDLYFEKLLQHLDGDQLKTPATKILEALGEDKSKV